MAVYMGEEEVIQKNMALAQEKVYTVEAVSYTHLDVYKRQSLCCGRTREPGPPLRRPVWKPSGRIKRWRKMR